MIELFTNLVAGVIGAILGAFVAYRRQVRESNKLGKGAARAVYIELTANATAAQMAASGSVLGAIRQDVYLAETARLATYLTPSELLAVAWAYAMVPEAMIALENLRRGGDSDDHAPDRILLSVLTDEITKATRVLNRRVWSAKERAHLERNTPG